MMSKKQGLMEMVKGGEFIFSEKRWLKKGITGVRFWFWLGII